MQTREEGGKPGQRPLELGLQSLLWSSHWHSAVHRSVCVAPRTRTRIRTRSGELAKTVVLRRLAYWEGGSDLPIVRDPGSDLRNVRAPDGPNPTGAPAHPSGPYPMDWMRDVRLLTAWTTPDPGSALAMSSASAIASFLAKLAAFKPPGTLSSL